MRNTRILPAILLGLIAVLAALIITAVSVLIWPPRPHKTVSIPFCAAVRAACYVDSNTTVVPRDRAKPRRATPVEWAI